MKERPGAGVEPKPAAVPEVSDEILAVRLQEGNREAFDDLVRRYHRRIRVICTRMMGSTVEVEDLCQDTFLRMYKYRSTYQSGRKFSTWLDRICVNVCLRHRERRNRREEGLVRMGDRDLPAGSSGRVEGESPLDPEALARTAELTRRVNDALGQIAAPYRAALVLRIFGDLSYQEIADTLECSIGTVMSRINRARQKMKEFLKDTR